MQHWQADWLQLDDKAAKLLAFIIRLELARS
jgi:hypothetical protein